MISIWYVHYICLRNDVIIQLHIWQFEGKYETEKAMNGIKLRSVQSQAKKAIKKALGRESDVEEVVQIWLVVKFIADDLL